MGEDPNDKEKERVQPQPRDGSRDEIVEEKNRQGTHKFSEVGSTNKDLRIGRNLEDLLGYNWCNTIFKITMAIESEGVTGVNCENFPAKPGGIVDLPKRKPYELAFREDNSGPTPDGEAEIRDTMPKLNQVISTPVRHILLEL